jgi:hypothetical protein
MTTANRAPAGAVAASNHTSKQEPKGVDMHTHQSVIRAATAADQDWLSRLARVSSRRSPHGHVLIAERDCNVIAAIELGTGVVLAEPKNRSSDAVQLLRGTRYQVLRQGSGVGHARSLLRRLAPRPAV